MKTGLKILILLAVVLYGFLKFANISTFLRQPSFGTIGYIEDGIHYSVRTYSVYKTNLLSEEGEGEISAKIVIDRKSNGGYLLINDMINGNCTDSLVFQYELPFRPDSNLPLRFRFVQKESPSCATLPCALSNYDYNYPYLKMYDIEWDTVDFLTEKELFVRPVGFVAIK